MKKIKNSTEKHTISWLKKLYDQKDLNFEISIQRKEAWDLQHKGNLIVSILMGIPLECLLFEEAENDTYLVLDGKQRSTTILKFINNQFKIDEKCKVDYLEGENIVGKTFDELSEDYKQKILEYELTVSIVRTLDEKSREALFFMRNQAVPLTNIELSRVLLGSSNMDSINIIGKHNFVSKTALGTQASINKCKNQQLALECLIIEHNDKCSNKEDMYDISSKNIMKFAEKIGSEGVPEEDFNNVINTFDYLDRAILKKSPYLKKIHTPMVYAVAKLAIERGILEEDFVKWMDSFFNHLKECPENKYNEAVSSSSAKLNQVQKRLCYIKNHFQSYFLDNEKVTEEVDVKVVEEVNDKVDVQADEKVIKKVERKMNKIKPKDAEKLILDVIKDCPIK
ncbi:hypothetical protein BFS06_14085 [Clostridium perfringens]|uniref:GmrSD restriction endonucleases N-terminal domain-containing protein n=1 Tax=Clostridium perfringens TaxID=1502 RepID=A0A140GRJ9_CLOPF|nr:DUF262 domain-containing protein [Clostridium perfringens]AMN31158.1 hypothetical protein JFP838_pA0242 [Clostridium perfringens]TBX14336.1 hypothetical protein BFS06_14085 [Clostridium perfringens]